MNYIIKSFEVEYDINAHSVIKKHVVTLRQKNETIKFEYPFDAKNTEDKLAQMAFESLKNNGTL